MDMLEHFRKLFAYDDWANTETLRSLKATGAAPSQSLKRLTHIFAAKRLWLERLKQEKQSMAVWPDLSLDECEAEAAELSRLWQEYLRGLTLENLSDQSSYTNTKGEPWTSAVEDVLMHVVMHSAYHRGQIAADLRAAGHTPAYTDFIYSVREGLVE